jgi:hypothetical protein
MRLIAGTMTPPVDPEAPINHDNQRAEAVKRVKDTWRSRHTPTSRVMRRAWPDRGDRDNSANTQPARRLTIEAIVNL